MVPFRTHLLSGSPKPEASGRGHTAAADVVSDIFRTSASQLNVIETKELVDLVAWIIPKDVLSLCFSTPGIT